jgi:two-component system, cell cycle response regulator DivK
MKLKILLVEDNDVNRFLMRDFLSYYGHDVIGLSHASNFFQALEETQPDLILMDLKLADMDGFELLKQLQKNQNFQHIPVIVISGLAFESDKRRALDLGVHKYLVKPINLKELNLMLHEEFDSSWRC